VTLLRFAVSKRIAVLLSALGFLLFGAGCTTLSTRHVSDPRPASARLRAGGALRAEVDALAQPLIARGESCGLVVGVCSADGKVQSFGYGGMTRGTHAVVPDGDTLFEVGSLTKVFVAATLAILVEEGKARYTDTVRDLLPPDVVVNDNIGRITLLELATHTSGLPRHPDTFYQFHNFIVYFFTARNPYHYIRRDSLYDYLRSAQVPPPERCEYVYSNLGYGLLAHLLELRSGQTLPELIETKICRPLGMKDTSFAPTTAQRTRLAQGHAGDQPKFIHRHAPLEDWDMGEIMRGSGGLYSTANDLMIFARSNLGQLGHRLDPLLAKMHATHRRAPREEVAFGWVKNSYPEWGTTISYMNGVLAGYSSYFGMDTSNRVAVVVLQNNFNWDDKIGHNLVLRLSSAVAGTNGSSVRTSEHVGGKTGPASP
jgi:CubicO group peptidase (beta-lactamase class C family)